MFVVSDDFVVEFVEFEMGIVDYPNGYFAVIGFGWLLNFVVFDVCFYVGLFVVFPELIFDG